MNNYLEALIRNLDEEGRIVFQGTVMGGYSSRQAILNAYGACNSDELSRDPFTAYWTIKDLPEYVSTAIMSTSEEDIEKIFWDVWENK